MFGYALFSWCARPPSFFFFCLEAPTPNTQLWGGALVRVDGLTAGDSAGTVHKLVPDAVGHKRLVWIGKYSCWVEVTPSGEQSKDLDSSVSSSNVLDIIAAGRASLDPPIGATVDSWENLNLPPTRPMQPVPAAPAPATEETWLGWLVSQAQSHPLPLFWTPRAARRAEPSKIIISSSYVPAAAAAVCSAAGVLAIS